MALGGDWKFRILSIRSLTRSCDGMLKARCGGGRGIRGTFTFSLRVLHQLSTTCLRVSLAMWGL